MFELRLSHSGVAVHVAFGSEGQEAFLEGHVIAFARLGGVPARIRYDNARALVARVLRRPRPDRDRALRRPAQPLRLRLLLLHPGREGCPREGRHRGRGRPPSAAVLRARSRRCKSLADLNPRPGGRRPARPRPPHRRPAPDGRRDGRGRPGGPGPLPAEPFDSARVTPVRSTPRPGSASASASTRFRRGLPGRQPHRPHRRHPDRGRRRRHGRRRPRAEPDRGTQTLLLDHYLEILVRKPGAMPGALATAQARETGVLTAAHEEFWARARRKFGDAGGTRALVEVLLLHRGLPFPAVHAALEAANGSGSADPALVAIEARRITRGPAAHRLAVDRGRTCGASTATPRCSRCTTACSRGPPDEGPDRGGGGGRDRRRHPGAPSADGPGLGRRARRGGGPGPGHPPGLPRRASLGRGRRPGGPTPGAADHRGPLPAVKRLAEFDLGATPSIAPGSLAAPRPGDWISAGEPVVLLGDSGPARRTC